MFDVLKFIVFFNTCAVVVKAKTVLGSSKLTYFWANPMSTTRVVHPP